MQNTTPESEWLEADGLGGFASGTAGGARTRRYHALLLTATAPPAGRMVLVNGIEAWLAGDGIDLPLMPQFYTPGIASPAAPADFSLAPWPKFTYRLPGGGVVEYEVFVARDACETVLRWRCTGIDPAWRLQVRPLLSGRDYHALHHENPAFDFAPQTGDGTVTWRPYHGVPAIGAASNGAYVQDPEWYRNFLYVRELERGLDDVEDLASPGIFSFSTNNEAVLIFRAGAPPAGEAAERAEALATIERTRRQALDRSGPWGAAAENYLVARQNGSTVLAGFPWFTDWGRDSFIALRGLAIVPGRLPQAAAVLLQWAGQVNQGMLPNRFPDQGSTPEYNAVDASLWFIIAVHDYLQAAPASPVMEALLGAAVRAILDGYAAGTRFGIAADADGLLKAGVPGVQLTWMDAKIGDHVVTPRIGKPVEVQALWINALRTGRRWSQDWAEIEAKARLAFAAKFCFPKGGLYDVVDDGHVPGAVDASIRPNQIFAVGGLPFAILDGDKAREVVDLVEAELLTPMGLRSLSPGDSAYIPYYRGGPAERDGAYHQGTVWPWLLGGFVQAWLRVHGDAPARRQEARTRFLDPLLAHAGDYGIGHLAEVADGAAPHRPGGCPFQAWSVGELIRIQAMLTP